MALLVQRAIGGRHPVSWSALGWCEAPVLLLAPVAACAGLEKKSKSKPIAAEGTVPASPKRENKETVLLDMARTMLQHAL